MFVDGNARGGPGGREHDMHGTNRALRIAIRNSARNVAMSLLSPLSLFLVRSANPEVRVYMFVRVVLRVS